MYQVCHSKSGEINPVKVANLVKAYVDKYKHARKHRKAEDQQHAEGPKASETPDWIHGVPVNTMRSLPLVQLLLKKTPKKPDVTLEGCTVAYEISFIVFFAQMFSPL